MLNPYSPSVFPSFTIILLFIFSLCSTAIIAFLIWSASSVSKSSLSIKLFIMGCILPFSLSINSILFLLHSDCMYLNMSSISTIPVLSNSMLSFSLYISSFILSILSFISAASSLLISVFVIICSILYSSDFCLCINV